MTDVIQRIDIWAQSLCRELRQKSCLVPYSVMIEVIQAVGAALPPPPGERVPPAVKVDQIEAITMHFLGHPTGDPAPHLDWPISRQWTSKEVKKRMQNAFEAVGLTPSPDPHPATEQPDAVQEAREAIIDEIEEIISETHDMDVTDRDYAENIVGWLHRHHPAALRALEGGE